MKASAGTLPQTLGLMFSSPLKWGGSHISELVVDLVTTLVFRLGHTVDNSLNDLPPSETIRLPSSLEAP